MDAVTATPLEPGQLWRHREGPWPSAKSPVSILDVAEGWVRFYVNECLPDERMREPRFREFYDERVQL